MSVDQLKSSVQEHFEREAKHKKGERDLEEEKKVYEWLLHICGEKFKAKADFADYIRDGCVLSNVMTRIVFNSVPKEDPNEKDWGSQHQLDRVKDLIWHLKRYGVHDVFEPDDLLALRDIGRVTRNIRELAELADKDPNRILPAEVKFRG